MKKNKLKPQPRVYGKKIKKDKFVDGFLSGLIIGGLSVLAAAICSVKREIKINTHENI
jgi:hypothetical protein